VHVPRFELGGDLRTRRQRREPDLPRELGTRRAPVEPSRDHEVQGQPQPGPQGGEPSGDGGPGGAVDAEYEVIDGDKDKKK